MSYHIDKTVNTKIIELIDELCQWERNSSRGSTLLLIPHNPDEQLVVAVDGKPVHDVTAAKSDTYYVGAFSERKSKLLNP